MRNDGVDGFFVGLLTGITLVVLAGLLFGVHSEQMWHREAIEHGAGRYNPTTGEFEWVGDNKHGE